MVNVTLVVPPDELVYLSTWLSHVVGGVGPLAPDTAAWLRSEITSTEVREHDAGRRFVMSSMTWLPASGQDAIMSSSVLPVCGSHNAHD